MGDHHSNNFFYFLKSVRDVKTNLAVLIDDRFLRLYNLRAPTKAQETAQLTLFQTQPESIKPFLFCLSKSRGYEFMEKVCKK